jgi:predicted nucleic acid-binding Zn ribbon protein
MPDALAGVLRKAPLTPDKVAFAWRTAVGPAVAAATSVELRDGILFVRAHEQAWTQEVHRSAALIQARLAQVLGVGVIRRIDVSAGQPTKEGRRRPK